mmetsp:Transcript_76420/g.163879  ORF Transcript_76420/g.163879 Transcript_76420/m.163879 type:complete len:112 (+) Transcript_76420:53-388(+)
MLSAVVQNAAAAPATLPVTVIVLTIPKPEAATLWSMAKRLPAETIPMDDCHAAASDPAVTPALVKPKVARIGPANTVPAMPMPAATIMVHAHFDGMLKEPWLAAKSSMGAA